MDVETAFLNAELQEEIYCTMPPGYGVVGKVWRLVKSLYGLKQSPREWNENINAHLLENGYKRMIADRCIYIKRSKRGITIIALYVDDLIIASSNASLITSTKKMFTEKYNMSDLGKIKHILGCEVQQSDDNYIITMSQQNYVTEMLSKDKFTVGEGKIARTPMQENIQLLKKDCPSTPEEKKK